ncbi:unnamed protein product [Plutella xylostella]|uniref:(diamondback moth) hypothetical protein n=1 Tax=Plutella xylostella TaxID=51655 RepID=A0A8S4G0V5_PLUXY|nr:unnamed protein product [Plutella xylostella]
MAVIDKLFPYASEHVKQYLEAQWETAEVKEAAAALRKLSLEDEENKVDGVVKIPAEDASKEDQIEGLVNNVKWLMGADRKVAPLKTLQGLIWKQGYDNGDIKGHVYDDVLAALEQWHSVEGQKVYIYSSGSVQAQKLLFGQSLAGDLLKYIDGHFDTAVGAKQEAASYTKIVEQIACKPEEVLFLTDILKEAEAARSAGLLTALLSREGNAPLPDDVTDSYPVLQSFAQLTPSNKRKPEQEDEPLQPAKVPKTDPEVAEKPAAEEASAKTDVEKTEKMEVEEEEKTKTEETKTEDKAPVTVETIVEEITDTKEPIDAPMIDAEPIVTEDKTEAEKIVEKEPVKMEEEVKVETAKSEPAKNGTAEPTEVKETSTPTVITEIEEVTDKQPIDEVGEIIEDLEPIVEEPQSVEAEMADLQNVGEVLEKECDEILSKVQDVTNLDSIAVKPMLNSIAEENNMETENLDTNELVDRILDTEQEMKMERDIENSNKAIDVAAEAKKSESSAAANGVKEEVKPVEAPVPEAKEKNGDETSKIGATEESKVEESSPTESKPVEEKATTESQKPEGKAEEKVTPVEKEVPAAETKEVAAVEKAEDIKEVAKMNGNGTNGNTEALNGDASKQEELSARLTAENGKAVNGANGDSNGVEAKEEGKEVAEIKVKSVPAVEAPTDPIEQATEA